MDKDVARRFQPSPATAPAPAPAVQPVPVAGSSLEQGPFHYPIPGADYRSFVSAPASAAVPHFGFQSTPYAGRAQGPFVAAAAVPRGVAAGGVSPYAGLPSHRDISFGGEAAASTAHVAPATAPSGRKESAPTAGKRKGGPGGLNKVCGVSPALQKIVGEPAMARTEIVKQLWAYIRKNNLQDPNNKRKIICNDELRIVFETDSTDMFKMNKLLSKHIQPLEVQSDNATQNLKKPKSESTLVASSAKVEVDQLPMAISENLASFLGTGEKEICLSEANKRVWEHIRINKLEDPANAMAIICDPKLQQLFGCGSISAFGVSELLKGHLFTKSQGSDTY